MISLCFPFVNVRHRRWGCSTSPPYSIDLYLVARGGEFSVSFDNNGTSFDNVHLVGPVSLNFIGQYTTL